jgi:calcineurin-like phosphoesterase family protein
MKIQINNKQNVFFCSDPHYNHLGIVMGTSTWIDKSGCRPFQTVEDHDNALVTNINKTVGVDDILFCLGDWSFGNYKNGENVSNIRKFREQINCKTIHHILGNHCQEIRKNADNSRELFESVNDYLEICIIEQPLIQGEKAKKQDIILSHYSMKTWNKASKGSFQLFGHSHGSLKDVKGKSMDVGFDTHKEFRPYSYEEIKELLKDKEFEVIDHHE